VSKPDPSAVDPYAFAWDLKTPCNDCPFLKSTPCHDGIASDLPTLLKHEDHGNYAHSCHKTHPGADGWVETYQGPVQHCAGFTIMKIKSDNITTPMLLAKVKKKLDFKKMDLSVETFKDLTEMAFHYLENHHPIKMHILRRRE
jgi:hypothetical protein